MKLNIENITLFTDASFNNQTMMGGAGFWAKGGVEGQLKLSGSFGIKDAAHSACAEALASFRAIDFLLENPDFNAELSKGKETRLILVTDCQGTKSLIDTKRGKLLTYSPVAEAFNRF